MTRRGRVCLLLIFISHPKYSIAAWNFDPSLLNADVSKVGDLDYLSNGEDLAPGDYQLDVYVNEKFIFHNNITLKQKTDSHRIYPCLSSTQVEQLDIKAAYLEELNLSDEASRCIDIDNIIKDSKQEIDTPTLRLNISIPQIYLTTKPRGSVPQSRWDEGVNAALFNYAFSGDRALHQHAETGNSYYLNLRSSLNMGAWRLHNYSTWRYTDQESSRWNTISSYLERAIIPLRSTLVIGDGYSESDVLDSFSFRGVKLSSDENMLPDSMKGFAPDVRGIARTHAQVTIRQNNNVIYQTYVAPGAFNIADLYPTSSSGDLYVTIRESDGDERTFIVPYSTVPILQRTGVNRFSFLVGHYRDGNTIANQMRLAEASWIQGLPWGMTVYGGSLIGENYTAYAYGVGKNLGNVGALSFDSTHAKSTLRGKAQQRGSMLRLRYAKSMSNAGTNVQFSAMHYPTPNYYTIGEVASSMTYNDPIYRGKINYRKKNGIQLTVSQALLSSSSVYTSWNQQSFWDVKKKSNTLQLGFNTSTPVGLFNFAYSYTQSTWGNNADKILSISYSLPIDDFLSHGQSQNPAFLTVDGNTSNHSNDSALVGISGSALEKGNLNYNVRQGIYNEEQSYAAASYSGAYSDINASYSRNVGEQQLSYGANGGIVIHRHGVVFSQPLGDTNILVDAQGANDVELENNPGVTTNNDGFAVVPYATNYRLNRVALNTASLPDNIEIDSPVSEIAPTKGAIVKAIFPSKTGQRAIITLSKKGQYAPFGTLVTVQQHDDQNNNSGIVSDNGQVYLSGLQYDGVITAQWDKGSTQCRAPYHLAKVNSSAIQTLAVQCE